MNKQEILETQTRILRDIFGDASLEVNESTSANDVDGWDSMTHMQVIAATEKEFGLRFALGELQALKNVGDMAELILAKKQA